ncbi:heavy metal sensor signal transduction histidine kinase [Pseudomonas sp. CFT9]|nr:heavy metal sensor signal transduction histidine kinase [Pseudomonas sp. CFT9]
MACTDRRSDLGRCDPRPAGAQRLSDRTEGRIDAQARNEIDGGRDFRLTMQTCVAALRLPGRMLVEQVAGCWWAGWPDGVESAQVTMVAASMSAKSLKDRIPLTPVPKELQQMVSSFNAMLSRLDDAFVRLSNFSADIAHELRTPVSNLMTHTEVVLSRKRNIEDYEDNLYSNLDDLKRMSRMIDDMLFLAKSDHGCCPRGDQHW